MQVFERDKLQIDFTLGYRLDRDPLIRLIQANRHIADIFEITGCRRVQGQIAGIERQ